MPINRLGIVTPQGLDRGMQTWGDSLTLGTTGGLDPSQNYPAQLSGLLRRPVYNGGVGGDTAQQIQARQAAYITPNPQINGLWFGRNGVLTDTIANIVAAGQAMINNLSTSRFYVLSVINKTDGTENPGSANDNLILALNAAYLAAWPNNYIDVKTLLNDNTLRVDGLHPTGAGYAIVAAQSQAFVNSKSW